jgi:hypothetical protein
MDKEINLNAWRPIETAPTDGRQILVSAPGGIFICPWPAADVSWNDKKRLAKEGIWPDYKTWQPTHWMPLPARPAPTQEEG